MKWSSLNGNDLRVEGPDGYAYDAVPMLNTLEEENNQLKQFIRNGVELGCINIPDQGDPAYEIIVDLCDLPTELNGGAE